MGVPWDTRRPFSLVVARACARGGALWLVAKALVAVARACCVPAYQDGRLRGAPSLVLAEYATRPPCAGAPRMRLGKLGGSV